MSGLEILEPGMKRIRLQPSLLGLDEAEIQIPALQGIICIKLTKDAEPVITLPDDIILEA